MTVLAPIDAPAPIVTNGPMDTSGPSAASGAIAVIPSTPLAGGAAGISSATARATATYGWSGRSTAARALLEEGVAARKDGGDVGVFVGGPAGDRVRVGGEERVDEPEALEQHLERRVAGGGVWRDRPRGDGQPRLITLEQVALEARV